MLRRAVTNNVKFSVAFKRDLSYEINEAKTHFVCHVTEHNNFLVVRYGGIVFSVFRECGHLNVTGVKTFEQVERAIEHTNNLFKTNINAKCIRIDNSTSLGSFVADFKYGSDIIIPIDLWTLKENIKADKDERSSFNFRPHIFPGAVYRRREQPTIILFSSGKYIVVGAKSPEKVAEAAITLWSKIARLPRLAPQPPTEQSAVSVLSARKPSICACATAILESENHIEEVLPCANTVGDSSQLGHKELASRIVLPLHANTR